MLRHQTPHETKQSNQRIEQMLEILNNVAIANRQITTAITEIFLNASGGPLLTQPVPEERLKPSLFIDYDRHDKEDEVSAESLASSAVKVHSSAVNAHSLCPDTPLFSTQTNETPILEKHVHTTPPPLENLYPAPSANCTGEQSSTPADKRGIAPTESPSGTSADTPLKFASYQQHALPNAATAEANTFVPPTLAAKTDQAPPEQALDQRNLAPNKETTESNSTASSLAPTSLPKPSTPVFTAEFPEAAHRARRKKKSKRQPFPRTTEVEDDIYLQEASQRNQLQNQALHSLSNTHRVAITAFENDTRTSLLRYAFQSIQDIRRDLTVIQENGVRLAIAARAAQERTNLLEDHKKTATETSNFENISFLEPPPSTDSESQLPDLQSSSSSERRTNSPSLSGKFWDTSEYTSDSESSQSINETITSSGYWNDPNASYHSPEQHYKAMCSGPSHPYPLRFFFEREASIRDEISYSAFFQWNELHDDFETTLGQLWDTALRLPATKVLSALPDEYSTFLQTSFCEFLHVHLICCQKLECSFRHAIVHESANSQVWLLETLENHIRNEIHHTHILKTYKIFGLAHLTTNRLVMAQDGPR